MININKSREMIKQANLKFEVKVNGKNKLYNRTVK